MPTKSTVSRTGIQTFQIGSLPKQSDLLRIGVTRMPPRGVRKSEWDDCFDVWFPNVAPSRELLARAHASKEPIGEDFRRRYLKELDEDAEKRQAIALLAEVARRMPIAIGCFCADEAHCHRSILRDLLESRR